MARCRRLSQRCLPRDHCFNNFVIAGQMKALFFRAFVTMLLFTIPNFGVTIRTLNNASQP